MQPIVLATTLLASLFMVALPRRWALMPALTVIFLTPRQQLMIAGIHLSVVQIFVLAGLIRLLLTTLQSPRSVFPGGIHLLDKLFLLWSLVHVLAFILLVRQTGAALFEMGFLLEASFYFVCRYFLRGSEDIVRVLKVMAGIAGILAFLMSIEFLTRVNLFSYLSPSTIVPWVRDGRVRAQGVFANSITAGVFGATLLPLFVFLASNRRLRLWGLIGIVAAIVIVFTSLSSTAVMAFVAALLALSWWPLRAYTRAVRIGFVFAVILLALAMKAPVWYLIARVNPMGGHGYDRAFLISATIAHFSEWWLVGTTANPAWGGSAWDTCNEFITQAISGGVGLLALFTLLLTRSFALIGKAIRRYGSNPYAWMYWCIGCTLFAHLIAFLGVDYFDMIGDWWYLFLAMITIAVARTPSTLPVNVPRRVQRAWESELPAALPLSARINAPVRHQLFH
jgi:hypothetical protein